jgi:hypothetical protein
MDLAEALKEVLDAAKQPKQFPSGAKRAALAGEAFVSAIDSEQLKGQSWYESLTPAQKMVCRWIWETCAQHYKPWEPFELGFLCEYNNNHELAVWVRIARIFAEFIKIHPSANKREIVDDLLQLSAGVPVKRLKNRRAKELAELWKQGAKD